MEESGKGTVIIGKAEKSSAERLVEYADQLSRRGGFLLGEFYPTLRPVMKERSEGVAARSNLFASCPPFFKIMGEKLKGIEEKFDLFDEILSRIDI